MKSTFTKKLSVLFLFTLLTACMLSGCSLFDFDASGYIKACLDANAHGEFTEYAKITGISEEEAAKQYNAMLDQEVSYLSVYNLTEERTQDFRDLYSSIYKNFKYEVGEASKNDDGSYSVPVTSYKLQVFKSIMADAEAYITDYVNQEEQAGNTTTEDDIYTAVTDYMYDTLSANLATPEYAEPVTITVTVLPEKRESSIVYSISPAELQTLLQALIDVENVQ